MEQVRERVIREQHMALTVEDRPDRVLTNSLTYKAGGGPEHVTLAWCQPDRHNRHPTSKNMGVILPGMNQDRESQPARKTPAAAPARQLGTGLRGAGRLHYLR
ncbi:hypothetical protein BN381_250008 [Candidatus Microthrix parvicella RN1]|uniref:Uncharacterized protein n=1 Tax=Candidatus Neomicrothrix parvicella RN1 TaxID=1229780 RepID=R4YYS6_9ACTN|nr:hypothetical protein BN381_250008 [Candidatus Microthrix parvicella RN1]